MEVEAQERKGHAGKGYPECFEEDKQHSSSHKSFPSGTRQRLTHAVVPCRWIQRHMSCASRSVALESFLVCICPPLRKCLLV
eukprot:scaffold201702_cov21-Tisochrysis_lutea.AAC.1